MVVTVRHWLTLWIVLFSKGSLQELKLYGLPGVAEVSCDNNYQVSVLCMLSM